MIFVIIVQPYVVGSVSVVEVNTEVCVCWLVVCSSLDVGISFADEINSDIVCPFAVYGRIIRTIFK